MIDGIGGATQPFAFDRFAPAAVMSFRKLPLIVLPFLAVATVGTYWMSGRHRTDRAAPHFLTVTVEKGDVVRRVVASGALNPLRSVQVGSQISGVIVELSADFNTPVKRGDVIARLDTSTHEANVRLATAELESARAQAELAEMRAARIRSLKEEQLVPPAEVEQVEVDLRQARAAVRIRSEHLERARLELARCTIVSPTDGIVISRNVDVGQTVAASLSAPVLFEIAEDLTRMMINALIPEADIGMVREGQRVEFGVDAYRGQIREGRVVQIRKAPIVANNVVMYDTVIHVANDDLSLNPGMTAEVAIITEERQGVLRVRNNALRALLPAELAPPAPSNPGEGARVVYRLADPSRPASLDAVVVRPGLADLVHTEILEGLASGDVLVTGLAPRRSEDGSSGGGLFRGSQARF
jgi:HlyD family secretion protein